MNHAVSTAGQHQVGITTTNDLRGFSNRLTGRRTGCQAVQIWPLSIKDAGKMSGRHVGFKFQFKPRIHALDEFVRELLQVGFTIFKGTRHQIHELHEVLLAFTSPKINAEPSGIKPLVVVNSGIFNRLSRRTDRVANIASGISEARRIFDAGIEIETTNFRRKLCREMSRIKMRNRADAVASFLLSLPHGL
jgi:hypothetical protein